MVMQSDVSIKVNKLSKTFRLPISRKVTLQSYFVNPFEKQRYRVFQALKDVDFNVREGEFFSIIGHNGVGKSTLLKIIAGIYDPESGTVEVNGRLVPFLELGVGFQPELTARENVYLNGILLGLRRKQVSAYIEEIFRFADLEDFKEVPVKNFSSGMQVRLAFSVAIKVKSEVMLLDEVLAVGDAEFQKKCYRFFDDSKGERTILFVSHDMDLVRKYSDRVMYMKDGNTYEIGEPDKMIDMYKDEVH